MKKYLLAACAFLMLAQGTAQVKSVELNKKYHQFNNGADFPAESSFMVNTQIDESITMVIMQISNRGFDRGKPLYETSWEKETENVSVANLVSHYKLRQNTAYDFKFLYYRSIAPSERQQMQEILTQTCYSSLQSSITEQRSRYRLRSGPREIYNSLNYALQEGLVFYRQKKHFRNSEGFSELIYTQLKNTVKHKTDAGLDGVENIEALKQQIAAEVKIIVNTYDYVIEDEYEIRNYQTQKLSNALALNIGYGAIYNDGDINNLKYFDAPYAGFSFAFGNRIFSSNFWNNTSLSAGVFLKNFKPNFGREISGPVVNLPLYAAFGYRMFNYFKFNAGAVVMEDRNLMRNTKSLKVQPFIGLSMEMYLWMGFNKRR